jgi:hypothetical protein
MGNYPYCYTNQCYDFEGREFGPPTVYRDGKTAKMMARYRVIIQENSTPVMQVRITRRLNGNYNDEPWMIVWFDNKSGQPKQTQKKEYLIK